MPSAIYHPDCPRPGGRGSVARDDGRGAVVPAGRRSIRGAVIAPTSVRDVAAAIYGRPDDDRGRTRSSTCASSAPDRPGSRPRVYGASEGLSTVAVEAEAIGGQAGTSSMIRNYLGFPRGVSGMRLAQRARNQAIRFGTRFFTGLGGRPGSTPGADGAPHVLHTEGGDLHARAVVLATGVTYRKLGVERDRGARSATASTTAARCRSPARWRAPTSWSSAAATRPARRRSTSPGSPAR